MNPKCTLPEEKRAEALQALTGWGLSLEEEKEIRALFPQYLFFRNDYRDDGWNISDPIRICTCTACGESFEAMRGNYRRGRLHHEKCNCQRCGTVVEGIAASKYTYNMPSLASWIKIAIARAGDNGELLIQAGNARRRFTWDDLTGEIDFYPEKLYSFSRNGTAEWKKTIYWEGCHQVGHDWIETKTIGEPFQPNMMGYADYAGAYIVLGLADAIERTDLKYCQILEFFEHCYSAGIGEREMIDVMKYLGWACILPQIEMAVKLGFSGAVTELVQDGRKNAKLLNWNARTPAGFLRMGAQDAKTFIREEMDFSDLKDWKSFPELKLRQYAEIRDTVGGRKEMKLFMECCRKAGATPAQGNNFLRSMQPDCARYALPAERILREWNDYLDMAAQLGYDLTEKTVAMPKELRQRHDTAAETIKARANEAELKKYKKRRRMLENRYAFRMAGYCILIPKGTEEIIAEGKTLHHCVGGYAVRHVEGKTTILFLRKTRTPARSFLTIEMETVNGIERIRQIHGFKNENYEGATEPRERFGWFLNPWLEWVNAGSERDRAGNPVLPAAEEQTIGG